MKGGKRLKAKGLQYDFGLIFKRDFVPYFNSKFKIYNSKFNK